MPDLDFDRFLALPRLSNLRVSPDGGRLAVCVLRPGPDGKRFRSSVWELDTGGGRPARRLTRSGPGEGSIAYAADGSLLFTSGRPDPDADAEQAGKAGEVTALWQLPAEGGEARLLVAPKGGVDAVRAARSASVLVFAAGMHPGSSDLEQDEERGEARRKAGVDALLFESFPIRYWDHYLGPRERHLFAGTLRGDPEARLGELRDLTPDAGHALVDMDFDVSPDGRTIVTAWRRYEELTRPAADLVAIDRETGTRRTLASGDAWHEALRVSPDGRHVACIRVLVGDPERADRPLLWLAELAGGDGQALTSELGDLWPHDLAWAPDGRSVWGTADLHGRVVAFRIDIATRSLTVVDVEGSFSDICPTADGSGFLALRSSLSEPPCPVRVGPDGGTVRLPFPGLGETDLEMPGAVERLTATASDGTPIGSWLVRPADASAAAPAPVVVFIHGGPMGSWTGWHWRWNAQLLAARGYAVLMPDPALSTGYGQAFLDRGWGHWGEAPYTDLMAAVDAALQRADLDAGCTAAMGGSFGGYMANWVAGQSDRFRAIVTHASLWELRGFHGTTDDGPWWETEFGDPYLDDSRYQAASPHRFVDRIRTPMLVIHGELDHRVPISEALRLWTDLRRHSVASRFLYFPDENHWILKPQNSRLWYATVLAFLDEHVLGKPWQRPELL